MPERGRHYRIHIENARDVASRIASGIGDTVAERIGQVRYHQPNSGVARKVAIGVGVGAAAAIGGREVLRRLKRRRASQEDAAEILTKPADKPKTNNPTPKDPELKPDHDKGKGKDKDKADIYGVDLPNVPEGVLSWINNKDNVRVGSDKVPDLIAEYIRTTAGESKDVEEALKQAREKTNRLFITYLIEVRRRIIDDVGRRGFEVGSGDSSLEGDNYSPNQAIKSFAKELGTRDEQTREEFEADIRSEIDCLEMSYIRQSALPALEKIRASYEGLSGLQEIAEKGPAELASKDLVKLNLAPEEEARDYQSTRREASEEEPTIDEYAARVKGLIEKAEKIEGSQGKITSFGQLRDLQEAVYAARIDASDCLDQVYNRLDEAGKILSGGVINLAEERRRNLPAPAPVPTHDNDDGQRGRGNRFTRAAANPIARAVLAGTAIGGAIVGAAWLGHELTEDNGASNTSISYNIDLSHDNINASLGAHVDHVIKGDVQGNNFPGNRGGIVGRFDQIRNSGDLGQKEAKDILDAADHSSSDGKPDDQIVIDLDAQGRPSESSVKTVFGALGADDHDVSQYVDYLSNIKNKGTVPGKIVLPTPKGNLEADVVTLEARLDGRGLPEETVQEIADAGYSKDSTIELIDLLKQKSVSGIDNNNSDYGTRHDAFFDTKVLTKGHTPVTICHATGSEQNPYVKITVDDDAVDGNGNNSADHNRDGHQDGEDIIPPGSWDLDGRNWNSQGQETFNSGCKVVEISPTATSTSTATATATNTPRPTETNTPVSTPTLVDTATPFAQPSDTPESKPSDTPTATEVPPTATNTPVIRLTTITERGPKLPNVGSGPDSELWLGYIAAMAFATGAATLYQGWRGLKPRRIVSNVPGEEDDDEETGEEQKEKVNAKA